MNYFEFGSVIQMSFYDISYLELWQGSGAICAVLVERIMSTNSVKLFCIWTSGLEGHVVYKISYLELWRPSWSVEWNHLCNFGRGHYWGTFIYNYF